jgi:hypothetical protein
VNVQAGAAQHVAVVVAPEVFTGYELGQEEGVAAVPAQGGVHHGRDPGRVRPADVAPADRAGRRVSRT